VDFFHGVELSSLKIELTITFQVPSQGIDFKHRKTLHLGSEKFRLMASGFFL